MANIDDYIDQKFTNKFNNKKINNFYKTMYLLSKVQHFSKWKTTDKNLNIRIYHVSITKKNVHSIQGQESCRAVTFFFDYQIK
jgi:hypothetical protein